VKTNNSYYIEGIKKGDKDVLHKIYNSVFGDVKRFVKFNKGTSADAEDIFHNALMQIFARIKANQLSTNAPLEAYILRACKNLWYKELKKKQKHTVTNDAKTEVYNSSELASNAIDQQKWDLFDAKLKELTMNCQKVLELYFSGLSSRDIMLSQDYKTELVVRQRIFKCKSKLIKLVKADYRYKQLLEENV